MDHKGARDHDIAKLGLTGAERDAFKIGWQRALLWKSGGNTGGRPLPDEFRPKTASTTTTDTGEVRLRLSRADIDTAYFHMGTGVMARSEKDLLALLRTLGIEVTD